MAVSWSGAQGDFLETVPEPGRSKHGIHVLIAHLYVFMKTKLTITVEKELVPRAKRFARKRGTSLSSIIEDALVAITGSEDDFVGKWRGRFQAADTGDPRYRYLKEKYLADSG